VFISGSFKKSAKYKEKKNLDAKILIKKIEKKFINEKKPIRNFKN
jgi:hypothetical protein